PYACRDACRGLQRSRSRLVRRSALNVPGLESLGSFHHLEADLLTLVERPEPFGDDGRVVHEDVLPARFGLNEAITLRIVEPLDRSLLRHLPRLLSKSPGFRCSGARNIHAPRCEAAWTARASLAPKGKQISWSNK